MNRMRRVMGFGAALALVALVITLGSESRAIAQVVRAVLVRNQDEPGRNPYSQNVGCFGTGCSVTFPPVPAGQRLVVTFVNAFVANNEGPLLLLGGHGQDNRYLLTAFNGAISVVNSPVLAYYEAGETPTLKCECSDAFLGSTLSGYFIALP